MSGISNENIRRLLLEGHTLESITAAQAAQAEANKVVETLREVVPKWSQQAPAGHVVQLPAPPVQTMQMTADTYANRKFLLNRLENEFIQEYQKAKAEGRSATAKELNRMKDLVKGMKDLEIPGRVTSDLLPLFERVVNNEEGSYAALNTKLAEVSPIQGGRRLKSKTRATRKKAKAKNQKTKKTKKSKKRRC